MRHNIDYSSISTFELDDHLILLQDGASNIQVLTPLAKYIWNACKSGNDSKITANEIAKHFDIPLSLAMRDVEAVITRWMQELSEEDPLSGSPADNWLPKAETSFTFPRFTLQVRYDSQEIADLLNSILAHVETPETHPTDHIIDVMAHGNRYLVVTNGENGETAGTKEYAAVMVFREIVKLHCSNEDWLAVLHASGVAWQNDGIIFPASSGSGKTTLAAALIRHGFHYINDDIIPLERTTCNVIPVPLSLCIKSGSWEPLSKFYPELQKLRSFSRYNAEVKYLAPPKDDSGQSAYQARYLIIPRYQIHSDHHLLKVSAVEGLQAIVEGNSSLNQPLKPEEVGELTAWIGKLRCYQLSYNNLDAAIKTITELVSTPAQESS